jgi:hypothetical protein
MPVHAAIRKIRHSSTIRAPLTSEPRHGLPSGKEPPLLPPDLKVDPARDHGKAAGHPTTGTHGRAHPAALVDPPRASNLVLVPGLVAGDTSLQLYFDAPADGWTEGTSSARPTGA